MKYTLIVSTRAEREHLKIVDWYTRRSFQATENFLLELKDTFDKITTAPFHYRSPKKNYREIRMKKYPYYVVYSINEHKKQINVLTIYHTSRNPESKFRNL
jgi:plasmid stabilization system protein ParE